jgi:hypothetical protein
MVRFRWCDFDGAISMARFPWCDFDGAILMVRFRWCDFHGAISMVRFPWCDFDGAISMVLWKCYVHISVTSFVEVWHVVRQTVQIEIVVIDMSTSLITAFPYLNLV